MKSPASFFAASSAPPDLLANPTAAETTLQTVMVPWQGWIWFAVHLVLALVWHEAGHVCAGLGVGGRLAALGLGLPTGWKMQGRLGGCVLFVGERWWQGMGNWLTPPPGGWSRHAHGWVAAAGPAFNLGAASLLASAHDTVARWAALAHLAVAVANLIPTGTQAPSDGRIVWRWLRNAPLPDMRTDPARERWAQAFRSMGAVALAQHLMDDR